MNIYALVLFLYCVLWLGINMVRHGEVQRISPVYVFLSQLGTFPLLILGGFFTVFHWPQYTMLIISALAWGVFVGNGFESQTTRYGVFKFLILSTIAWVIYGYGNFLPWLPIPH